MKNFVVLIFCFWLLACADSKQERVTNLLDEWIGYEFKFPESSIFTVQANDTVNLSMLSDYKIVTYIDSIGCTSCKMQLKKWKRFMNTIDSIKGISVTFIYNLSTKKLFDVYSTLKEERFTYPICVDEKDSLNILNSLPLEKEYQTFLLDNNNVVIAIGNPVYNAKVKELYLKILSGEEVNSFCTGNIILKTEVVVNKHSFYLGSFDWHKEQKVVFTLKNVGDNPLVLQDINTSCGCTNVSYSQEPVRPGNEIKLDITYKAEHPEFFNKAITVYCNAESSPIKLNISGDAK